jgi:hypothetical protein
MSSEEAILAKWRQLSEPEREQLLDQIEKWLAYRVAPQPEDVQRAVAAVENTWASLSLDRETLRWVAEDKELEYDLG